VEEKNRQHFHRSQCSFSYFAFTQFCLFTDFIVTSHIAMLK